MPVYFISALSHSDVRGRKLLAAQEVRGRDSFQQESLAALGFSASHPFRPSLRRTPWSGDANPGSVPPKRSFPVYFPVHLIKEAGSCTVEGGIWETRG